MSEILSFRNVKKYYKGGGRVVKALDDVSFSVRNESVISVIGESGSGKTTLAMIASFLEYPTEGEVIFKKRTIGEYKNKKSLWKEVQLVFQDPGRSLNPKKRIEFLLKEPLLNYSICSKREMEEKIDYLMDLLEIERFLKRRKAEELSGGEKQRIAIARALSVSPSLLILDEPFSFLDPVIKERLLLTLLDYKRKNGMTWIFITHDLNNINQFADSIVILYKGIVMESGKIDILENPYHPYTKYLLFPDLKEKLEKTSGGCPFLPKCNFKIEVCKSSFPELKFIDERYVRCHLF
jgi:peptide/nickel transport system ATP-binding protein/oligopeptide transport system ATP-binding protein